MDSASIVTVVSIGIAVVSLGFSVFVHLHSVSRKRVEKVRQAIVELSIAVDRVANALRGVRDADDPWNLGADVSKETKDALAALQQATHRFSDLISTTAINRALGRPEVDSMRLEAIWGRLKERAAEFESHRGWKNRDERLSMRAQALLVLAEVGEWRSVGLRLLRALQE